MKKIQLAKFGKCSQIARLTQTKKLGETQNILDQFKQLIFFFKVMDPVSGWCEIRPYDSDIWKFLQAAYKCVFFLLSATVDEDSLKRILGKI